MFVTYNSCLTIQVLFRFFFFFNHKFLNLGQRESGADVRSANVTAVMALANILKSSLGPQGLDKMLVDDIGDVTITNDGATILKQLEVRKSIFAIVVFCVTGKNDVKWSEKNGWPELNDLNSTSFGSQVEHPAAKVLVELANLQVEPDLSQKPSPRFFWLWRNHQYSFSFNRNMFPYVSICFNQKASPRFSLSGRFFEDTEVGDGTTSVVIIAAELLKRANELVKNNIHPTVPELD